MEICCFDKGEIMQTEIKKKKILMVTTNISKINEEIETGVYFEEFAVPYLTFEATGYEITVASPNGGISPVDPNSYSCSNPMEWDGTKKHLDNTKKLSDVNLKEYDVIFFPGGHGPMFDIAKNKDVAKAVEYFYENNKIIAAVCHGPAGLLQAKNEKGDPIVKNHKITSFTNKEEYIVKRKEFMPFLLEDELKKSGAEFIEEKPWSEHVEVDKNIITGQNQNSALKVSEEVIKKLSAH